MSPRNLTRLRPALQTDYAVTATWINDAQACARCAGHQWHFHLKLQTCLACLKNRDYKAWCWPDHHDLAAGFASRQRPAAWDMAGHCVSK